MEICEKCGFGRVIKTYRPNAIGVDKADIYWLCLRCKNEVYGGLEDGHVHVEPEFEVLVKTNQEMDMVRIMGALRKADLSLKEISLGNLKKQLVSDGCYSIKYLSRNELEDVKSILKKNSIIYEIK
ncbi:hypothetical protein KCM76_24925 [Zooshikella marina]|uniref:hypothetical protein n=1 Tax=Zooshikella ganghwensis TaxID=202772 RepID=UPI001BAFA3F6|nr:hypothetical protein [Zooshikella ganghwensis]MBU2709263.1 hypothetical protein [Zooshikella ganghwensis]